MGLEIEDLKYYVISIWGSVRNIQQCVDGSNIQGRAVHCDISMASFNCM